MPQIGRYAAGELIFREGDPGSFACLVRMGEVELYHPRDGGNIAVATVTEGQMFGELALVDGGPRMAAARALTEVEVDMIDRKVFLAEIERLDAATRENLMEMLRFVRETVPYEAATPATPPASESQIYDMTLFLRGLAFGRGLEKSGSAFTRTLTDLLIFYATRRLPPA
jgi:CRP-like cAMP-binding protein